MEGESGFSGVAHRAARFRAQGNKIKAVVRLKYIRRVLYRNRGFVVDRILHSFPERCRQDENRPEIRGRMNDVHPPSWINPY